jgi:hypothetical protein
VIFLLRKSIYFSTYPPSKCIRLSHHFTSASKHETCCLSHFRTSVSTSSLSAKYLPRFWTQMWIALRDKHFPSYTRNISLWICFALSTFSHRRCTTERCSSVATPQARSPLLLLKPAYENAHERLLPRPSWSWTVLLPSGTREKRITSITAVLFPFVT